jgi:DNA repair exonuclease SbcCD ATPase subunit
VSSVAHQQSTSSERAPQQDLRGTAAADAAALLAAEIERCRTAARKTLASLKETIATLERSSDEAIGNNQASQAAVTAFAEKVAAAANAASNAAAERARSEVRAQLEKVQASLDAVRSDLEKTREQLQASTANLQAEQKSRQQAESDLKRERESLKAMGDKLQAEQAARTQADAALKDAEKARQEAEKKRQEAEKSRQDVVASHDAEIKALRAELEAQQSEVARVRQQLEAEKAERARLVSAIRGVVDPGESAAAAPQPKPAKPKEAAPAAPAATSKPAAERKSESPQGKTAGEPAAEPELVAYVQHLFNTLEAMYSADVSAGRKSDDLLNRLTQNLRSARNVFRNHIGAPEGADLTLFDHQLSELLGNPEESAFARHLGIAAYECSKAERT